MKRALIGAVLLFLAAQLALEQSTEPPAPIFPSDGKPPVEANGAELLQAVCPGQVTSDDAVLSMQGCESHAENFGGTILLTRSFQGWAMKWYKAGVETSQCHKVSIQDGREILVCIGETGGQGNVRTELYVEDLLRPAATLMAEDESPFFSANDNSLRCGEDPEVTRSFIEKVEFAGSAISVTASFGQGSSAQPCSAPVRTIISTSFLTVTITNRRPQVRRRRDCLGRSNALLPGTTCVQSPSASPRRLITAGTRSAEYGLSLGHQSQADLHGDSLLRGSPVRVGGEPQRSRQGYGSGHCR
jgi:hypothetical protein